MSKIKTHEEFRQELYERFGNNIDVTENYSGHRTKINFHCNICDNDWMSAPISILQTQLGCPECANKVITKKASKGRKYGKFVEEHPELIHLLDYEKNTDIDVNNLSSKSGKRVWLKCDVCGHSWNSKIATLVNSKGNCPNCYLKNAHKGITAHRLANGPSFAEAYPDLLNEWDYDKNIGIDPYKLPPKSHKKVWWKCKEGHEWETRVSKRTTGHNCPFCVNFRLSRFQKAFFEYVTENYQYQVLNEHDCTLKCRNPKTGFLLPYDNEIILSDTERLIVEVNGEQHYGVCMFTRRDAESDEITPEEELKYLQWKDDYKKQFALSNGYHYLALPYWTFKDDSYKSLIDEAIHKILSTAQN